MRLEYVKSFIAVVNSKSFSVAAKEMFVSQPTISTHIKHLESEIGVQLLVRSTKDVILTEEGRNFYPFAVKLLETEKEALDHLKKKDKNIKGTVSIAVSSVPGNYIVPRFLAYMTENFPDINFKISESNSDIVIKEVLHFESDIGIGCSDTMNEKCICEPLLEDEMVLITPNIEKYRRYGGKFPIDQLKKETFVTRDLGEIARKLVTENIERELGINLSAVKTVAQFATSEMMKRAVETGVGVAFISRLAVMELLESGKVLGFSFPEVNTKRTVYLIHHKDKALSVATKTTMKCLVKFCKEKGIVLM